MDVSLSTWLLVAAALFCMGVYGAVSRRNAIGILMSVELILNAVNINIVAFWRYITPNDVSAQLFVLIVIAVAAAEAAVGLAIVIAVYRQHNSATVEELDILRN